MSSVLSSGQFCGKSLRDPGHGVSGHVFDGTRKDKETPARTNAKGVQYELRERASADAEDESCRVASVVERSSC